jgi:hypothetical protein
MRVVRKTARARRFLALAIALGVVFEASCALADGGFLPYYGSFIMETRQQAFITYDEMTGTEELIIQPSFTGDARDFGWIVPVPAQPELSVLDAGLFRDCQLLTMPIYRHRGDTWGCSHTMTPDYDDPGDIDIHNEQTVGIYRTLTVSAGDSQALTDSLFAWGYLHVENQQAVQDALQYYIERDWYFVAMKADTAQLQSHPYDDTWYGNFEPVRFVFSSDTIVYPLRISIISAPVQSELCIYTAFSHRLTFPGAITEYANALSGEEIAAIRATYPTLGPLLSEGQFLTKLSQRLIPEDMTDDLHLIPAVTDAEYREVHYSGTVFTEGLVLAVGLIWLARPWRRRHSR